MRLFFIVGWLLLVASGVARAEGSEPMPCQGSVTYNPLGYYWSVQSPAFEHPVWLHFHEDPPAQTGAQGITLAQASASIMRAFNQWTSTSCGGESSHIAVRASGSPYVADDRGDVWESGGLISSRNVVLWENRVDQGELTPGTVAYTEAIYVVATGLMVDADMLFNAVDYSWRTTADGVSRGCVEGEANCYDIESVALHEAGHFLGFGHVECVDSIMYRTGRGSSDEADLAWSDEAGFCALYGSAATSEAGLGEGEACSVDTCAPELVCVGWPSASGTWSVCARECQQQSDCREGFECVTEAVNNPPEEVSFCRPGIQDESSGADLCAPCSRGADCETGLCVSDGSGSLCSRSCLVDRDCPGGFLCGHTNDRAGGVCWPEDPEACGVDSRGQLNAQCYVESREGSGDAWFNPCGPGLICTHFKPRCGGQTGACVLYCDTGAACPDENLACCFGVDGTGGCLGPSEERVIGGCFDIRNEGESCVTAEQSVCAGGLGCFDFGDPTLAKCYSSCSDSAQCDSGEICSTERYGGVLEDGCHNDFELCCQVDAPGCLPGQPESLQQVGLVCDVNADCASGLCLKYRGEAVCSRSCDPVTATGCPADDVDVDGDGVADGGFECVPFQDGGRCWPKRGPIGESSASGEKSTVQEGSGVLTGCACDSSALGAGYLQGAFWQALLLLWAWRRHRPVIRNHH